MEIKYLENKLKTYDDLAVAFSGGVDSTLLLKAAYNALGDNAMAITIHSNMHANYEIEESKKLAKDIGIKHITVELDAFKIDKFSKNDELRCYYCKLNIFDKIKEIAVENGFTNICDGSNYDDLSDYRPGMKALEELNIISPLKDLELTKDEIRRLSKEYGLYTYKKPAFSCLATRIPTGEDITEIKLRMVEKAEYFLTTNGINQFRVRIHGEVARVEVSKEERENFFNIEFMDIVNSEFKKYGFKYVSLDLGGYIMGNMNKR